MDLGQLRVFLAVIDAASVTRAAEIVGLTPGAVSQQLRGLGSDLGVELFVRAGREIAPTPHALRLADHARAILHQVGRMEQEFRKDEAGDNRPFHFATGATALIYRLGKPLRLLRRRFPQNEILVTVAATEEIVAGLLARRFDLGLISMPVAEDKLPFCRSSRRSCWDFVRPVPGAAVRRWCACSPRNWRMRRSCSIRRAATCA